MMLNMCETSRGSWKGSLEKALGDDDNVTMLQHHILGFLALDDVADSHLDALLLAIHHPDEARPVRRSKRREAARFRDHLQHGHLSALKGVVPRILDLTVDDDCVSLRDDVERVVRLHDHVQ